MLEQRPLLAGGATSEADLRRAQSFVGRVISNRYRVDTLVAMGGMGAVYVGEHIHMHKRVAIKILHPSAQQEPAFVQRFEREAIAGAHIQHPNVAVATDFGELERGSYFLVLEYIQGTSLSEIIARGRLPVARAIHVARQIAAALEGVHAMGIVHRDLKPLNVMVAEEQSDWVKLIDFGFAKVPVDQLASANGAASRGNATIRRRLTIAGVVFGTLSYLAPEAAQGMDAVDARADLYALGLILYEMLAGRPPFLAESAIELFQQQCQCPPPPFRKSAPGVLLPAALERVVMRLLAKHPGDRYESATALILALDEVCAAHGIALPAAASSSARLSSRPPTNPAASLPPPALVATIPPDRMAAADTVRALPVRRRRDWVGAGLAFSALALAAALVAPRLVERPAAHAALPLPPIALPAAPATAEPAPAAPLPPGVIERKVLLEGSETAAWYTAAEALVALAKAEPAAFAERPVAAAAREVAMVVGRDGGEQADRVYSALAHQTGSAGLDVLYDLIATHLGTPSAKRAAALLREPGVLERASPELKIAFELRAARCQDKLALLDRAVEEGDRRSLIALETNVKYCFRGRPEVTGATQRLRDRLQKR